MIWKLLLISFGFVFAQATKYVDPEYLDELWGSGKDEEFAKILNIRIDQVRPDKSAVAYAGSIPENESYFCDFVLPKEEKGINFLSLERKLWTGGKIPYFISRNSYNATQRHLILDAIKAFNKRTTNLKLVPYRRHKDYVFVFSGITCVTFLMGRKRKGGPHGLSLKKDSCLRPGTVQHEFMHAAGLPHEHNRMDREQYVEVLWDNIPKEKHKQFDRINITDFVDLGPYEYCSVMHYGIKYLGKVAFKILKQDADRSCIGQQEGPTDIDIQKIDNLYS